MDFSPQLTFKKNSGRTTYKNILPKLHAQNSQNSAKPVLPQNIAGKRRSYHCYECPQTFNAHRLLKSHVLEEHKNKNKSICEFCSSLYASPAEVTEHQAIQCCVGKYTCLTCTRQYSSIGRLRQHYQTAHKQNVLYRCTLCKSADPTALFSTQSDLGLHFDTVHVALAAQTPTTDDYPVDMEMHEEFLDEFLLRNNSGSDEDNSLQFAEWEALDLYLPDVLHLQTPQTMATVAYNCPQCDQSCDSQKTLLRHLARFHGMPVLNCSICEASFNDVAELRCHKATHNQQSTLAEAQAGQQHQCGICDRTLKSKAALIYHIKTHSRGLVRPHACPFCGKEFHVDANLKQHLRIVHAQQRHHVCQLCDAQYATLDHLRKHVLSQHQNERKHACHVCGKRFTQLCHLKQHLPIHPLSQLEK